MPDLDRREITAIFLGGMAGSLLRVWLARTFSTSVGAWPWTTFAINISGSFALACIATHLQLRFHSHYLAPLLGIGFCGAYTTFSTMQLEILRMVDHNRWELAAGYAFSSILAGYLAIVAGTALMRRMWGRA
jgi:CrcB protein